jgi:hypothetical protein
MHDFHEGVGPFTISDVLNAFQIIFLEFGISAAFLNQKLNFFQYIYNNVDNKPSAKFTDENTKILKIKSWNKEPVRVVVLWTIFPCWSEQSSKNNIHFAVILTLLHITDIVFSPVITDDDTVFYKMLIMRYFEKIQLAFPDVKGINKMHHMVLTYSSLK